LTDLNPQLVLNDLRTVLLEAPQGVKNREFGGFAEAGGTVLTSDSTKPGVLARFTG